MNTEFDKYTILLEKFFCKKATTEEIKELNLWIATNNNHQEFDSFCEKVWGLNSTKQTDPNTRKEIWKNLNITIRNHDNKKRSFNLPDTLYRIAVGVLIPLCIGLFTYILIYRTPKNTSVPFEAVVDYGQKANLTLPDGTKVWLNSGSKLKYDEAFNIKERTIYLDGEAYFEVAKNPKKKFTVSCNGLNVEAIGTVFNVKGYHSDTQVTASLINGSIKVYNKNKCTLLHPNEALEYSKIENLFSKSKITDIREIDFWRRNILFFRSATLEEISKTLERAYGITIRFKSEDLKQVTFSGSIRNNSLTNVFHIISLTYPLSYNIKRDTVTISKE